MADTSAQTTQAPLTTTQSVLPTFGSLIGGAIGAWASSKLGLAADPLYGPALVTGTSALFTAILHAVGTKFGLQLA